MINKKLLLLCSVALVGLVGCKPKPANPSYSGAITPANTSASIPTAGNTDLDVTVKVNGEAITTPVIDAEAKTTYIIETALTGTNANKFSITDAAGNKSAYGIEGVLSVTKINVVHTGTADGDVATLTLTLHKATPKDEDAKSFTLTQMSDPVTISLKSEKQLAEDEVAVTLTLDPTSIVANDTDIVTLNITARNAEGNISVKDGNTTIKITDASSTDVTSTHFNIRKPTILEKGNIRAKTTAPAGDYTVEVTITDEASHTGTATATLKVTAVPVDTALNVSITSDGNTLQLTNSEINAIVTLAITGDKTGTPADFDSLVQMDEHFTFTFKNSDEIEVGNENFAIGWNDLLDGKILVSTKEGNTLEAGTYTMIITFTDSEGLNGTSNPITLTVE